MNEKEIAEIKKHNFNIVSQLTIASMLLMALAGALVGNYAFDTPSPYLCGFTFGIVGIIIGQLLARRFKKPMGE